MKKMASVVAIMAVFTLAVGFIMIGSVSEELKTTLGIDNAGIGTLVTIFSFTCMIAQLLVGFMVDKFGHKPLAIAGFLLTAVSIFLLGFATTFTAVVVAVVLLGIGSILCNTVGNTLLPVVLFDGKDPARASNFGCGFVGFGFVFTPMIIAALIAKGVPYNLTVSVVGVLVLVFAVFAMLATYPQVSTGFSMGQALQLLSKPLVLLGALALVCYIGMEWSINNFARPLMTEVFTSAGSENATTNAGYVLSLFGLTMAIGRFATSAIKNVSDIGTKIIAIASILAIGAIILLIKAQSPAMAIIGVLAVGLMFAPMFPTIVGVTFAGFDPSLYGSIFGIIFSVGLIGAMVIPKLIGNLSVDKTVQESLPIVVVVTGALVVVAVLMGIASKAGRRKRTG